MRETRRTLVMAWVVPSIALALMAGQALACVLTYMHTAPIDAAYRATGESGRGVLRAPSADVRAADLVQGITWFASLPVVIAATFVAASVLKRIRAPRAALVFAYVVTCVGICGAVVGLGVTVFGAVKIL